MTMGSNAGIPEKIITALLIIGSMAGLAGIDLILPALPGLNEIFNTDRTVIQFVIALYVAGSMLGLLIVGSLADHYSPKRLLIITLSGFAAVSLIIPTLDNISMLLALRFIQGILSVAPAVLAPGIIRKLFSEHGSLRAIGLMGSIESLSPAVAPIIGVGLLVYGWQASFYASALLAVTILFGLVLLSSKLPTDVSTRNGSYKSLLANTDFLRPAFAQGFIVSGLLVYVFSAPVAIVSIMEGHLSDFIAMQIVGISSFIIASNLSASLAKRYTRNKVRKAGASFCMAGSFGLFLFSLMDGSDPFWLIPLFLPFNFGLGLFGPLTFMSAIEASNGQDARAAAFVIVLMTGFSSAATAIAAFFIEDGLLIPTFFSLILATLAFLLTFKRPKTA